MMDNERILLALGEIKEEIGGLRADARNSDRRFEELKGLLKEHASDDAKAHARITELEHQQTRIKTWAAAISTACSALFALGVALVKG